MPRNPCWVMDVLVVVDWRGETKRASHAAMMLTFKAETFLNFYTINKLHITENTNARNSWEENYHKRLFNMTRCAEWQGRESLIRLYYVEFSGKKNPHSLNFLLSFISEERNLIYSGTFCSISVLKMINLRLKLFYRKKIYTCNFKVIQLIIAIHDNEN